MERVELEALDRPALIELVLVLHEQVQALQAQVAALETELARLRPPKTPSNSSLPPSQGFQANRTDGRRKKRGPKRGHLGWSRRRVAPDVVVACRPTRCAHCGTNVAATEQRRVQRRQVVALPAVRPVVVEAQVYAASCPQCGERTTGELPAGFETGIHVEVPRVAHEKLASDRQVETSDEVRRRVEGARARQAERLARSKIATNGEMGPAEVRAHSRQYGWTEPYPVSDLLR